jgi:hypothetical protein
MACGWLGRPDKGAHKVAVDLRGDPLQVNPLAAEGLTCVVCGVERVGSISTL